MSNVISKRVLYAQVIVKKYKNFDYFLLFQSKNKSLRLESHESVVGPTKAFVFIDNHPKGIAGGSFIVPQPDSSTWGDFPDARHENGANLSFADGHVEHWRWKEAATIEWAKRATWTVRPVPPGDRDLRRLQGCIPHK